MAVRSCVALVVLLLCGTAVSAQPSGTGIEVAIGAAQTSFDSSCDRCGLPGSRLGGAFAVNVRFEPRLMTGIAVLASARQGPVIALVPEGRVESQATQEEIVVNGFGGAVVGPRNARWEVVLLGGLGATYRQTHRRGTARLLDGSPASLGVPSATTWLPTAVAEVNVPIRLNRFASLIPSVRVNHTLGERGFRDHGLANTSVTTALLAGFTIPR